MQVILRKTVSGLGHIGDVVKVRPGYFRNYLEPRQMAFLANPQSLKQLDHQKKMIEQKSVEEKEKALATKESLAEKVFEIEHLAGEGGKLFGSVTSQEISEKLSVDGFSVDRKFIQLDQPIKAIGEYTLKAKLHPEVIADIKVNVIGKDAPQEESNEA